MLALVLLPWLLQASPPPLPADAPVGPLSEARAAAAAEPPPPVPGLRLRPGLDTPARSLLQPLALQGQPSEPPITDPDAAALPAPAEPRSVYRVSRLRDGGLIALGALTVMVPYSLLNDTPSRSAAPAIRPR